ncbi:MAG TPA: D-alanine--D-alanine ligase [Flavipsychrobacter sp.]|nr:D-alanine--D-alanine ligase [Flavipsychrobacter sp.]
MKKTVALIFGGKSAEFEISLHSASNIFNAFDKEKFDVILLGIDKKGNWFYNTSYSEATIHLSQNNFFSKAIQVYLDRTGSKICIVQKENNRTIAGFDVAFSIIHGTFGEDGTLQGYLKSLDIPFVGPDVLGSAICMDKEITKRLLRDNNIPIARFITLRKKQEKKVSFDEAKEELGLPMFVKPCNAGSSVGVNKVTDQSSFDRAVEEAFRYDNKILVEEAITGKEVECAILGNENPRSSVIGEIIPTKDFYSYDAKYNDAEGAKMKIPADIDPEITQKLRRTAVEAFKAVGCEGLARVDFFLRDDNSFVLNEINTLPGFTEISMYPKLWEHTGISYPDLISSLVDLAMDRQRRDQALQL